jgi:hypothetical protein
MQEGWFLKINGATSMSIMNHQLKIMYNLKQNANL